MAVCVGCHFPESGKGIVCRQVFFAAQAIAAGLGSADGGKGRVLEWELY